MLRFFIKLFFACTALGSLALGILLWHLHQDLPDVQQLRDVRLQVPLRIYSADGKLIEEFGEQRRIPVRLSDVPPDFINAILAIEDVRFYQHNGVDLRSLARAAVNMIQQGDRSQGGSTITMQVARNFFLTRQKTYSRKLNEILLALKIERELEKEEILELYMNKIFLGHRSYGIAAAAQVYYGTELENLSLAQMAMISGLPKAPSTINPLTNPRAALARRNLVLSQMIGYGLIDQEQYKQAILEPVTARYHGAVREVRAPYFAEMVRIQLLEQMGEDAYEQGLQVFTTLDSKMQDSANNALRDGLLAYDQRWGYRGPEEQISSLDITDIKNKRHINDLQSALVIETDDEIIRLQLANSKDDTDIIELTLEDFKWAKPSLKHLVYGHPPKLARDVVKVGDVVRLDKQENGWKLAQTPEIQGSLIAMEPDDGAIKALVGGFDYQQSKFNRVTQALRQPGSNFKPFVYSAALEHSFTPATLINDAPIVLDDPSQEQAWRPQNDNRQFNGPMPLRTGLIRSRNLVSIRILRAIGLDYALEYVNQFGFNLGRNARGLSLALGTSEVTQLDLTVAYAALANGGFLVEPYFIEHIEGAHGEILYQSQPTLACRSLSDSKCQAINSTIKNSNGEFDFVAEDYDNAPHYRLAESIIPERISYMMTDLLKDTVRRGTGRGALVLKRDDLAGKTGTTNDQRDAWFTGYNSDIVTSVWVGYDNPKSIGEYAARAALPIWTNFMGVALEGKPSHSLAQPEGIIRVRIDPTTGLLAYTGQKNTTFEIFLEENAPSRTQRSYGSTNQSSSQEVRPEELF